ncbi:MAG: hypothetical protein KDB53_15025, partial [Planctomycetes bacterium]|nr:hypothetical protein [Planctomycetota bacterium]
MFTANLRTLTLTALIALASSGLAQELPKSGTQGVQFVYATSPGGTSQLFALVLGQAQFPIPVGAPIAAVPSRWAHRRRTLGALETKVEVLDAGAIVCPMGDAAGNGALHLIDFRNPATPIVSALVATANPAAYDLAVVSSQKLLFCAEDDGANGTTLRGYSYATPGQLTPLTPATLTLPGRPSAYCNRMGLDVGHGELHVPTSLGIQVVHFDGSQSSFSLGSFVSTGTHSPVTNPVPFLRQGTTTWIVGTGA